MNLALDKEVVSLKILKEVVMYIGGGLGLLLLIVIIVLIIRR